MVKNQQSNGRANNAARSMLRILYFDDKDAKNLLAVLADGKETVELMHKLESKLTYATWNIVEGPGGESRCDDPTGASNKTTKYSFDDFSVGLTPVEQDRHKRLKQLYLGLIKFNAASAGPKALADEDFTGVQTSINNIERTLLSCDEKGGVIKFRESMWKRIEVRGNEFGPAKWIKRPRAPTPGQS